MLGKIIQKQSLRNVIVVPFALQLLVAVVIVGVTSLRAGQKSVQEVAVLFQQEVNTRIVGKLRSYTETPDVINQLNAEAFLNGDIDVLNASRGKNLFWQQIIVYPGISFVYCGAEKDGSSFGVGRLADDIDTKVLSYSNAKTKYLKENYRLNDRGEVAELLPLRSTHKPFDARRRPWYTAAKQKGKPTWSEIYLDFGTLLPTVTASFPVYNSDRKLLGVCAVDYFLPREVNMFLSSLSVGKTGIAFIVERSGRLVSTSTPEPTTRGEGENLERLLAKESAHPLIREIGIYLQDKLPTVQGLSTFAHKFKGEQFFVQVQPFQDKDSIDWLIVTVFPESDFMVRVEQNFYTTLIILAITSTIAVVTGIITAEWLSQPILNLAKAAKRLAEGQLMQKVTIAGTMETQQLETAFNQMAEDIQILVTDLEEKVEERTQELQEANREIRLLSEKLKEENLRLTSELAATRKIQQMILPRGQELHHICDLEIAEFIMPADEVGGDYYDVFSHNGKIKIGIGDVTGHGLESGMIMLMAQTAVRALASQSNGNIEEVLQNINQVIWHNVQRMRSDKNLTLALLEYDRGDLRIVGQHEEVIIVRSDGNIERIDTIDLGFPIGLEPEIRDFLAVYEVKLQQGDVVVLYTDGITEAENDRGEYYGIDRLVGVVRDHLGCSAQEINNAVIYDVKKHIGKHKVYDDITLLVMKQR
ncbi:MAG: SpoIIE family protein phosphatase [Pseudanabaenaceae cyanobacterium SKYGB_i_bin29]|nr:SpoIIE family protein phosphatase [Pseudanabaenaceae cyanobacterium SKYG29]MDW8422349.1 SpoIIE family protein phosphatase [Pseudanabaenaceae cyanobacterium SKYGB_i_bin29]